MIFDSRMTPTRRQADSTAPAALADPWQAIDNRESQIVNRTRSGVKPARRFYCLMTTISTRRFFALLVVLSFFATKCVAPIATVSTFSAWIPLSIR